MYAEIVDQDRDREIGPILFDICVDLGIVPAQMDPATWDALRRAIALHGADPAPFEARHLDLADPAPADAAPVGRKSEAHSATPAPTDNPDVTPTPPGRRYTLTPRLLPAPALPEPAASRI